MKRLLILLLLFCCTISFSFASDTSKDLSKKINTLIRNAERDFFSRKIETADELLNQVNQLLEQLKTTDAEHESLKTLQGKHDRLRKKVDQKLSSKTGSAQADVIQSSNTADKNALSHGAKSNLTKANREMDFAEKELAKGEKNLLAGKYNMVESNIFNMDQKLGGSEALLDKVVNSNRADPNHTDVAQAFQRLKGLQAKHLAFKQKAEEQENQLTSAKAAATAGAAALSKQWLPRIKPYIDYSGSKRLQFPGMHDKEGLIKQDQYFKEAKTLLADYENQAVGTDAPPELSQAIKDLGFSIEVYESERNAGSKNMVGPVKNTLDEWTRRFEQNKTWNPDSGRYLFVVSPQKIAYQKEQIKGISAVMPDQAAEFSVHLAMLEQENTAWQEKKLAWANRPQPFPKAGMTSGKLEKELVGLLQDRGIKSDNLHIVDRDWWVLKGEYRYMAGAYLSKDDKGVFWSSFNFRQIKTLTGYGPTELWEISEQKTRLP